MARDNGFFATMAAYGLRTRVLSSLAMAALAAAALMAGDFAAYALMLAMTAPMLWEYARIFPRRPSSLLDRFGISGGMAVLAAFCVFRASYPAYWFAFALVLLFCMSVLAGVAAGRKRWFLEALPPLYIGLPMLAALYIYANASLWALAYVFVITISTDTGAFIIGQLLKGPKFAPRISPKKTWSGVFGGVFCAFVFGTALHLMLLLWTGGDFAGLAFWALASVLLSISAQIGDLFESKIKRIAGIKDSSSLIPGHGGFLDRFDSFLFVAPFVALLVAFSRAGMAVF